MPRQVEPGDDVVIAQLAPSEAAQGAHGAAKPDDGGGDSDAHADPDAQTIVTELLDFTEYLPSDVVRSLTLIGKLDEAYADASVKVDELTTTWAQLPSLAADVRPSSLRLRADISSHLDRAVKSRVFAHAEAIRMSANAHRHYHKAKVLLSKLQAQLDHYPAEEQRSLAVPRSPQMARTKMDGKTGGDGAQKVHRHRVPKITVPGEVLAPCDILYDTVSEDDDSTSDDDLDTVTSSRRTPGPAPRIKLVTGRAPKVASRAPRRAPPNPDALSAAAAANAAALLNPPPENAVIGSKHAPWLRLTEYEMARLRKRMKKNATWTPSETMVARELKALNRGPDAYREAKKKADDEGRVFKPTIPSPTMNAETGTAQMPTGAISVDSLAAMEVPTSNRGMKLNEAKKLKREALAKQAAEDAEESARKMVEAAKLFLGGNSGDLPESAKETSSRTSSRSGAKRKREAEEGGGGGAEVINATEPSPSSRPYVKRTKTDTLVPPPLHRASARTSGEGARQRQLSAPGGASGASQLETPVPLPRQGSSTGPATRSTLGTPSPEPWNSNTVTTSVPTKPPAETPVPLPRTERRGSMAAVLDISKRKTRGDAAAAKRTQQPQDGTPPPGGEWSSRRSSSRGVTPGSDGHPWRRPWSRSEAVSMEPQMTSLAAERPRRSSTARTTPAPDANRPQGRRWKRPAPGVVSKTSSGGNTAVGKRKAAPKRKTRATRKETGLVVETEVEEVDDEGNPIDPDEPRYCLCNRVSFGMMIQCDNDVSGLPYTRLFCLFISALMLRWRRRTTGGEKVPGAGVGRGADGIVTDPPVHL